MTLVAAERHVSFDTPSIFLISSEPWAIAYTPNSILQNPPEDSYLRFAGTRPRFSTCGGVCWFQKDRYFFAVNMQTSSVQIYAFNKESKAITPIRCYTNQDGLDLSRPESICLSKDGSLLAIPNMRSGKLQIYRTTDEITFFAPSPVCSLQVHKLHGANFSPDGQFISYTGFGERSWIYTSRLVETKGKLQCLEVQKMPNLYEPLRPKSIDFSPDGHFAAIGYCIELSQQKNSSSVGLLATYARDVKTGIIDPNPISCVKGLTSLETVVFSPDADYILATDQVNDRITGHAFNKVTGEIMESWIALQNPKAELSFCHGIALTFDGKWVAVTNYGDDKVAIYEVFPPLEEGRLSPQWESTH